MTWRDEGFLSYWFTCAEQLNNFIQDTMCSLQVPKDDMQRLLGAVLLARMASAFQGVVILSERGMWTEARYVLRSMLEIVFILSANAKDPEFYRKHAFRTVYHHRKMANVILQIYSTTPPDPGVDVTDLRNKAEQFTAEIERSGLSDMSVQTAAHIGELSWLYDTAYRFLSSATHALVGDLGIHATVDANGVIDKLAWGPNRDMIPDTLESVCTFSMIGMQHTIDLFDRQDLGARYAKLWGMMRPLVNVPSGISHVEGP